MNLVIVESPAKGKTIEKYLGKDYKVMASFGHVRDLPEHSLGVDVAHDFAPHYLILPRAKPTISSLKTAAKNAHQVYLATDYDREGEAIAWHLVEALGLNQEKREHPPAGRAGKTDPPGRQAGNRKMQRITFHEITKDAIQGAIKQPRAIDPDLVNAQQARRILDRLVGYNLSPFLWKKVMKGLSAGRVQSVAVRLIVDREREIEAFKAEEYWTIEAELQKTEDRKQKTDVFRAKLVAIDDQKLEKLSIQTEANARQHETALRAASYQVTRVETKEQQKYPHPPFTTSTLQQEASHRLGFSAKKTMKLAQDLYEDGLITYMRTDSTNLAGVAVATTRKLIKEKFGEKYLPTSVRIYKTRAKGAQEAHEAIRPTFVAHKPETVKVESDDHRQLYDLIWRRMVACQMTPAVLSITSVDIVAKAKEKAYAFSASGSMVKFDGFLKVWPTKLEETSLPKLDQNTSLDLVELHHLQHFTEPPARYNEASLIKALEEHGIGRPSTYAPTISTIVDRGYVRVDRRVFFPQEIGLIVTDLLKEHFPDIVDIQFTASMEEDLDKIAEGKAEWVKVLKDFYGPFEKNLATKLAHVEKVELVHETTDEVCEKCGKPMVVKMGRFGKFLACTGFPECKNAKPFVVPTGITCPVCQKGQLVERKTRRGKTFWSCDRYPDCKAATWDLAKPATLPDPNKPSWRKNTKSEARNSKQ